MRVEASGNLGSSGPVGLVLEMIWLVTTGAESARESGNLFRTEPCRLFSIHAEPVRYAHASTIALQRRS